MKPLTKPNTRTALTLLFLLLPLAGHASIITNGDFENGSFVNDASNYMKVDPGSTAIDGWTVVNTVAWGISPLDGYSASSGVGFVDLSSFGNQSPNGQLDQLLTTEAGKQYDFSIDRQGNAIDVLLGGSTLSLTNAGSAGSWTTFTGTYTATSTSTLLSLVNLGGSVIAFVDNLSMTAVSHGVPGPTGMLVLLVGGLCFFIRRKSVN